MLTARSPSRSVKYPLERYARSQMKFCPATRPAAAESGIVQPFKFRVQFVSFDGGATSDGDWFFAGWVIVELSAAAGEVASGGVAVPLKMVPWYTNATATPMKSKMTMTAAMPEKLFAGM